jgi:hypothetical protein
MHQQTELFPDYTPQMPVRDRALTRRTNTAKRDERLNHRFNELFKKRIKVGNREISPDFDSVLEVVAEEFNMTVETAKRKLTKVREQ